MEKTNNNQEQKQSEIKQSKFLEAADRARNELVEIGEQDKKNLAFILVAIDENTGSVHGCGIGSTRQCAMALQCVIENNPKIASLLILR